MARAKTTNRACRSFVQKKKEFDAHQLYARWLTPEIYVVYSYGPHWPLYACIDGKWYRNTERISATTTKQSGQAHPMEDTVDVDRSGIEAAINAPRAEAIIAACSVQLAA